MTSGLYRLVGIPRIYRLIQNLLAGRATRMRLAHELIRAQQGQRVLDLGCGSGDALHYLPDCDYVGVDMNPSHIEEAKRIHAGRGRFVTGDATRIGDLGQFDLILGIGLLHHLDDASADEVLKRAAGLLREGGRMFTIDPCYVEGQHPFAKFLIDRDSGRAVRTQDAYRRLGEGMFKTVETRILNDLLRVPYTHCVMDCLEPRPGVGDEKL